MTPCDQYYLDNNNFPNGDPSDPRQHYENHGRDEGRNACDEWDEDLSCEDYYLLNNPDVAASDLWKDDPEGHYAEWGRNENRKVCVTWQELYPPDDGTTPPPTVIPEDRHTPCGSDYLSRYSDLEGVHSLEGHYENHGADEGRIACQEWADKYGGTPPPVDPPSDKEGLIIDTDIARMGENSDKNDNRGLGMAFTRFNEYKIEGIVATNVFGADGVAAVKEMINDYYRPMYNDSFKSIGGYPTPEYLLSVTFRGATQKQSGAVPNKLSEGARHAIEVAKKYGNGKKFTYDVWGTNTTLAEILKADGGIHNEMKPYTSGTWNRTQDQKSFDYIKRFKQLQWTHDEGIKYGFVQPSRNIKTGNRSPQGCQDWRDKYVYTTPHMVDIFKRYKLDFLAGDPQLAPWGKDYYRYKDGDLAGMYIRAHWPACVGQFKKIPNTNWYHSKVTGSTSKEQQKQFLLGRREHVFKWLRNGLNRIR